MSRCLSGEYEHKLDAKGRLIMPLKIRSELGESFMVTKGIDCCLYVYGMTEWEEFVEKLNKLPMTNRTARAFKRGFLAGAVKCEPDAQGRILLTPKQREYAHIDKEVYVIGNGEKARKSGMDLRILVIIRPAWTSLRTNLMHLILAFRKRMVDGYGICT